MCRAMSDEVTAVDLIEWLRLQFYITSIQGNSLRMRAHQELRHPNEGHTGTRFPHSGRQRGAWMEFHRGVGEVWESL